MESLISDYRFFIFVISCLFICGNKSIGTPLCLLGEQIHLCIFGKSRILCVLRGETPQHIFGCPGHILILMGVFLIPAFRLCILGLSYQRVIGLIGCGPVIVHGQRLTMKVKTYLVCNRSEFVYLVSNLLHVWRWMCFRFWLGFNNFVWNLLINTMSQK